MWWWSLELLWRNSSNSSFFIFVWYHSRVQPPHSRSPTLLRTLLIQFSWLLLTQIDTSSYQKYIKWFLLICVLKIYMNLVANLLSNFLCYILYLSSTHDDLYIHIFNNFTHWIYYIAESEDCLLKYWYIACDRNRLLDDQDSSFISSLMALIKDISWSIRFICFPAFSMWAQSIPPFL